MQDRYFSPLKNIIIEHENLVLDPSNNISLVILLEGKLFLKLRVGAQIACSLAQLTLGTKVFTLLIMFLSHLLPS